MAFLYLSLQGRWEYVDPVDPFDLGTETIYVLIDWLRRTSLKFPHVLFPLVYSFANLFISSPLYPLQKFRELSAVLLNGPGGFKSVDPRRWTTDNPRIIPIHGAQHTYIRLLAPTSVLPQPMQFLNSFSRIINNFLHIFFHTLQYIFSHLQHFCTHFLYVIFLNKFCLHLLLYSLYYILVQKQE